MGLLSVCFSVMFCLLMLLSVIRGVWVLFLCRSCLLFGVERVEGVLWEMRACLMRLC